MGLTLPYLVLLPLALFAILLPAAQILQRAGYSGWWAFLAPIPMVNVMALWWFAFAAWPELEKDTQSCE
jgi:uncharacterized membrane protein YhaH (DUF805 family)